MNTALAIWGLILFALYDAGTVWGRKNFVWRNLFWAGTVLWIWALISAFIRGIGALTALKSLFLLPCALFLLLTVYAIFFAIPFDGTELKGEKKVYTGGVYSLCRHPGVTFLVIALLFLVAACPSKELTVTALAVGLGDILYALLQDKWTFPKTLPGYEEYKHHSRFLLPDLKKAGALFGRKRNDR